MTGQDTAGLSSGNGDGMIDFEEFMAMMRGRVLSFSPHFCSGISFQYTYRTYTCQIRSNLTILEYVNILRYIVYNYIYIYICTYTHI